MTNTPKSSLGLLSHLSAMMFILFFVWGAWFAGLGRFMLEAGMAYSIGNAYACTPIAAIITPFFIGVFADRFINAEKLQGLSDAEVIYLEGQDIVRHPLVAEMLDVL